jgi:hypothetical protein
MTCFALSNKKQHKVPNQLNIQIKMKNGYRISVDSHINISKNYFLKDLSSSPSPDYRS